MEYVGVMLPQHLHPPLMQVQRNLAGVLLGPQEKSEGNYLLGLGK